MTIDDARSLTEAVALPPGYSLTPRIVRRFTSRNEWGLSLYHDGVFVRGSRGLNNSGMLQREARALAAWCWERAGVPA